MGPSEQQEHDRDQQADKTELFPRASSAKSTGSHLRQWGFSLRESRAAFFLESGEDSTTPSRDDQDAGSFRAVNKVQQSGQIETSTGANAGEEGPTTSPAARRTSEAAVLSVWQPPSQTVRARSSSAAMTGEHYQHYQNHPDFNRTGD